MPHLLLAGAPTGCWTNLGDEAILAGMADALRVTIPDVRLTVVTSSPPETYVPYGCDHVHFKDLEGIVDAVADADAVLLGGGSIFFDYWDCDATRVLTDAHRGPELWAGLALLAAAREIPVMTYDVGFNSLLTEDGLTLTRATLELATVMTVRDRASAALATGWGFEPDSVVVTGDPALTVEIDRGGTSRHGEDENSNGGGVATGARATSADDADDGPVLAVSLRQWETGIADQDEWNAGLAAAIDAHLDHTGGRAVFVPCHLAQKWPLTDDTAAARAVIDRMTHADRARIIPVEEPWSVRAQRISTADAVLAMRYHAALFGLRAGAGTVGLSYDAKVAGLFADLGVGGRCLELADAAAHPDRIAALLADPADGADSADNADSRDARAVALDSVSMMQRSERAAAAIAAHLAGGGDTPALPTILAEVDTGPGGAADSDPTIAADPRTAGTTPPPSWQRRPYDAVRNLLVAIEPTNDTRPEAVRRAIDSLTERLGIAERRPTVAILTNRLVTASGDKPHIGGAERYALSLARLLRDLGLAVTFYQGGGEFDVADFHGFPVYPIPLGESFSEFQTGVADEFYRRTLDSDHVIYLMPNFASGTMRDDAVLVSHGVWWDHELWTGFAIRSPGWYEHMEQIYTSPVRVISVDANTGDVLRAQLPAAGRNIRQISSAVDTSVFTSPRHRSAAAGSAPSAGLAAIGRKDTDEPLVLFPRRAEPIRGSELVEPIMRLVVDPCRFCWVGTGSRFTALQELAERDHRLTVRRATFDQMPKQYAAADVCVIPSVGSEGQSLSALEAMASGCAVIVTRIGGLVEVVTDGVDGLVCDPTADSIAAAIRRLVRDPGLRARLGTAARATALRHHELVWRTRWAEELAELGWFDRDRATSAAAPYDVIKFSVIDFEQRYQRPQQTAAAWGRRGRRVFYVQRTGHRPTGGAPYDISEVAEGVYTVRLALPTGFNLFRRPADGAETDAALRSLDTLRAGWGIDRAVLVSEFGSWQPVTSAAHDRWGWPVHYDCMDNWATFPEIAGRKAILAGERKLVETADSMTVSGRAIQRHWQEVRPDAALARNAADFDRFHDAPASDVPEAIADITGPVAGFIGDVTTWFDGNIVEHIASARPDVQFVFVGNVKRHVDLDRVEALGNVRFLGLQPYGDMPRYVRRFDVCLVPFEVSAATASMDLVKVYEYFAAGKPIVTTPVAEMVRYRHLLYLADGPEEFLAQLDAALAERDSDAAESRLAFARMNSWDARVDVIEREILPTLAGPAATAGSATRRALTAEAALRRAEGGLRKSEATLAGAQRDLNRTRATLNKLNRSRALNVVRRYWAARTEAEASARRARRAVGKVARRVGLR